MVTHRANQDKIIEDAIERSRPITIFLKSGVSLKGKVLSHDSYTIFLEADEKQTLVYKHFITSIYPARMNRPL